MAATSIVASVVAASSARHIARVTNIILEAKIIGAVHFHSSLFLPKDIVLLFLFFLFNVDILK